MFSDVGVDLLFAYLLTDTARQIFNDNSREYGNGLQKFEPNDLNKGMMLDLSKLQKSKRQKIADLYSNNNSAIVDEIDDIFKEQFAAL
jgi:adenine-specific DNA-methyltransferase